MDRKEKRIVVESRVYLFEVFNSEINLRFSSVHSFLFAFTREKNSIREGMANCVGRHNSTRDDERVGVSWNFTDPLSESEVIAIT